jgi:hypothetical protein
MVAFEISVNGHHVHTIGVGESGILSADVCWANAKTGQAGTECRLIPFGIEAGNPEQLYWSDIPLKVGDVVTVSIVERDGQCDLPQRRVRIVSPVSSDSVGKNSTDAATPGGDRD